MSAGFVLLAALFLAIPITAKVVTSFQIRTLVEGLKRRERQIDLLYARLDGLEQEREVIARAVLQVYEQRRWSATRRDLMAEELERARRRRPRRRVAVVTDRFVDDPPPVWSPDGDAVSAAAAEAAA